MILAIIIISLILAAIIFFQNIVNHGIIHNIFDLEERLDKIENNGNENR